MRCVRRILATVGLLALLPLAGPQAAQAVDTDTVNKAVVWVDIEFTGSVVVPFTDDTTESYESSAIFYCTGFFVSPQADIATAGHCIEEDEGVRVALIRNVISEQDLSVEADPEELSWSVSINDPTVYIGQPDIANGGPLAGKDQIIARVVAYQPFDNGDSALLRISNMTVEHYLTIANANPQVQEQVTSVGFPGSVDRVTDVNRQQASFTTGTVSSQSTTKKGVPVTQINAPVTQGMSGGPTLNANDEVIGVNSFGIVGETQPFNFVTDTEILREFLQANGVEMAAAVPSASASPLSDEGSAAEVGAAAAAADDGGVSGWVIALMVMALILIVGLGAVVVLLLRRQSPAPARASTTTSDSPPIN